MMVVTRNFLRDRARGMMELLRQDGVTGWRAAGALARYVLVRPGILRKVALPWIAYFLPGFHPWNVDDRALIDRGDSDYADARVAVA